MNNNSGFNTILLVIVLILIVGGGIWWYTNFAAKPSDTQRGVQINLGSTGAQQ